VFAGSFIRHIARVVAATFFIEMMAIHGGFIPMIMGVWFYGESVLPTTVMCELRV
jgi:hypothetical protein